MNNHIIFFITGMTGAWLFFICHNKNKNSHDYGLLYKVSYKNIENKLQKGSVKYFMKNKSLK